MSVDKEFPISEMKKCLAHISENENKFSHLMHDLLKIYIIADLSFKQMSKNKKYFIRRKKVLK